MTNTQIKPTSPHDQTDLDDMSKRAFQAHVAKLRKRHRVPADVKIKRRDFESLADLEAFMTFYLSAETRSGRPTAKTSRRTKTTSADSAEARSAVAAALAKKKANRDTPRSRKPAVPKTKPTQKGRRSTSAPSRPISALMEPGIYNSDPWRIVGLKDVPRDVDPSAARFRRQVRGVGKCTGTKLRQVTSAFLTSYHLAECARQEVSSIRRSPDAALLWHASYQFEEASLAYWFGADYSPQQINRMLIKIEGILTEWALAHCAGFRGLLPVWIRCKSKNGVGKGPARHLTANTIELFPRYFNELTQNKRRITMLHEMGHRSSGLLTPRDERHDHQCDSGWNSKENMCYRNHDDVDDQDNRLFVDGNPRDLAIAATNGNSGARKTALNNIDNYVSYMWNRHRDHKSTILYFASPGAKPPRRAPGETTSPSNGS